MKSTDLMIGNWVLYKGSPRKIVLLDDAGCALLSPGENAEILVERDLQPIPLTPEILDKNGFVTKHFFSELVYGEYRILSDGKHIAIIHGNHADLDIPICFVHELQNSLRLCRIDKEIVL